MESCFAVDVGDHLAGRVDVVELDALGHLGRVAAERDRDLVRPVAHDIQHDLGELRVREVLVDTSGEGRVDRGVDHAAAGIALRRIADLREIGLGV